jgi:hypothetical protein
MTPLTRMLIRRSIPHGIYALALASAVWAQRSSAADARFCPSPQGGVPAVFPDSIASLRVDEPLGRLRALCDAARDTVTRLGVAAGDGYPALAFHFDSLLVIAVQYGGASLDLSRPADAWMVVGAGGTIQHKVALSASWSSLRAALGTPQANARGVLAVRFCSFPNAIMTLNTDPRAVTTREGRVDLATIPASATIHHLVIMSRTLASHLQGC